MVKVLELFSGTGSVGKCCKELGWDTVSVDMILPADHEVDIMDFDYKQYPKDEFDIIWASPPCTSFSILQGSWIGRCKRVDGELVLFTEEQRQKDMIDGDKLVKKTLEIIDYFDCVNWFMENPQSGKLKDRDIMKNIPFYDVDYCMYNHTIRKRTRIWSNKTDWVGKLCDKSCGLIVDNKHPQFRYMNEKGIKRQDLRYRIPEDLIYSLFLD